MGWEGRKFKKSDNISGNSKLLFEGMGTLYSGPMGAQGVLGQPGGHQGDTQAAALPARLAGAGQSLC